jgi:hypothetical protein
MRLCGLVECCLCLRDRRDAKRAQDGSGSGGSRRNPMGGSSSTAKEKKKKYPRVGK